MNFLKSLFSGQGHRDGQPPGQMIKESTPCHSRQDLLERYGGIALEKQACLSELIDGLPWEVDLKKGRIGFAGKVSFPMQILGTLSRTSDTWLWSWANTVSDVPPRLLAQALRLRSYGEENQIALLSQAELPVNEEDLSIIGLIASGMFNASGYYLADFERGIMCVTVKSADIDQNYHDSHRAVMTTFPRFISLYEVDHRNALSSYLTLKGYEVTQTETKMIGRRQDEVISAEFNAHSRLTMLSG